MVNLAFKRQTLSQSVKPLVPLIFFPFVRQLTSRYVVSLLNFTFLYNKAAAVTRLFCLDCILTCSRSSRKQQILLKSNVIMLCGSCFPFSFFIDLRAKKNYFFKQWCASVVALCSAYLTLFNHLSLRDQNLTCLLYIRPI